LSEPGVFHAARR